MKLKLNKIFKGFPKSLKDPKSYKKVERELADILKCNHTHKTVLEYSRCPGCKMRLMKRRLAMKRLGFTSPQQYYEWRKIMSLMLSKQFTKVKVKKVKKNAKRKSHKV